MDSLKKDLTKTGLIIEGGGMRGIFAAGVVDYFLDKDIVLDNVIGAVSYTHLDLYKRQAPRASTTT